MQTVSGDSLHEMSDLYFLGMDILLLLAIWLSANQAPS